MEAGGPRPVLLEVDLHFTEAAGDRGPVRAHRTAQRADKLALREFIRDWHHHYAAVRLHMMWRVRQRLQRHASEGLDPHSWCVDSRRSKDNVCCSEREHANLLEACELQRQRRKTLQS